MRLLSHSITKRGSEQVAFEIARSPHLVDEALSDYRTSHLHTKLLRPRRPPGEPCGNDLLHNFARASPSRFDGSPSLACPLEKERDAVQVLQNRSEEFWGPSPRWKAMSQPLGTWDPMKLEEMRSSGVAWIINVSQCGRHTRSWVAHHKKESAKSCVLAGAKTSKTHSFTCKAGNTSTGSPTSRDMISASPAVSNCCLLIARNWNTSPASQTKHDIFHLTLTF